MSVPALPGHKPQKDDKFKFRPEVRVGGPAVAMTHFGPIVIQEDGRSIIATQFSRLHPAAPAATNNTNHHHHSYQQ